jgi:hypothetical protein
MRTEKLVALWTNSPSSGTSQKFFCTIIAKKLNEYPSLDPFDGQYL